MACTAWQKLEDRIREIASFRWGCVAAPEKISGVDIDCVLKPSTDHWIAIEITQQNSLTKVREDITKLAGIRMALFGENIYCQCYFVMSETPTNSMRDSGKGQKITVMSAEEFQNEYFDYGRYIHIRSQKQFGSLVNIETGAPENNIYIDVSYIQQGTGKRLKVDNIIKLLKDGKRIVLKGDFGLGKSRCVKEVFDKLTADPQSNPYAIAINLRDHWGAKRAEEILTRHFSDLGLNANDFIKSFEKPGRVYLLDGFDEIGTQSWSSDICKMQSIRRISVCGLKDLINQVQGGILITGREYYFNSDQELIKSLGLSDAQTIFLECQQEFTDSELLDFIGKNIPDSVKTGELEMLPPWLPKRPLVIQLLLKYAGEIFSVRHAFEEICGFWYAFLTKLCEREAKIYPALNPDTIRGVLLNLANQTRMSKENISNGHFTHLSFEGKEIKRLSISGSIIERLDLTNSKLGIGVKLEKCDIATVYGIASRKSIPEQLAECNVEQVEMLATTTLIKKARLSESQKLFVEMLRKIFFQPGAGRKESALLRGMGVSVNKQLGEKILNKLIEEKLITRIKGDEGPIYKPVRSKTSRVDKMLTDLTLSKDPLWEAVSLLS
jgi:hypothetical protein